MSAFEASVNFMSCMDSNEAVQMEGFESFSSYQGYHQTLEFLNSQTDAVQVSCLMSAIALCVDNRLVSACKCILVQGSMPNALKVSLCAFHEIVRDPKMPTT